MEVLLIGASEKTSRYSYLAMNMLQEYDHQVTAIANRQGQVNDIVFQQDLSKINKDFHTITLYVNPKLQTGYYEDIFRLNPKRVIFNPGTENPELSHELEKRGIEATNACTLVLLRSRQF